MRLLTLIKLPIAIMSDLLFLGPVKNAILNKSSSETIWDTVKVIEELKGKQK